MLALFSAGLVLGGLLSSLVLWLLSGLAAPLPPVLRYGAAVAIAVLAVLRDAGAVRFRLPQNTRQVPQDLLQRDLLRGSLQFGFELGTGVRTYVSSTAPYAVAVALLLVAPGWAGAALAGVGFGIGRAATPLVRIASPAGDGWDAALRARLKTITIGASAAVAVLLGWLVLRL